MSIIKINNIELMKLIKYLLIILILQAIFSMKNTFKKTNEKNNSEKTNSKVLAAEKSNMDKATLQVKTETNSTSKIEAVNTENKSNTNTEKTVKDIKPEIADIMKINKNYSEDKKVVEAEILKISNETLLIPPENPPKPLMEQKRLALDDKIAQLAHDEELTKPKGVGLFQDHPPKAIKYEPVSYVKALSPAGKAALDLEESGDFEYIKILNSGFETPKTISPVIKETPIRVDRGANLNFNNSYENNGVSADKLWSNVEFYKYQNQLLDVSRFSTPAKFEKNQLGQVIVHAPSGSDMQITAPANNILYSEETQYNKPQYARGFLSVDENEAFVDSDELISIDGRGSNGLY
jgi:hypothetical protein